MKRALLLAAAAGALSTPVRAADGGAPQKVSGCTEHVPAGKPRPDLVEKFPDKGVAGHVAVLEVVVEHGKGENVLPHGLKLELGGEEARALERAGFALPDPDGGAGPSLTAKTEGDRVRTTVLIPVVPLPESPGVQHMTLPGLPIAIARASGEVLTLCTQAHELSVDEPIADTPDAKPKSNPAGRRQREEWTTLKNVTVAGLIALVVGALLALILSRWLQRPKPAPPPPPPRPPWEVALEELEDLRRAELIENARFVEHFDRVSYIVRKYAGERYGFDGLESTTREMLGVLRRIVPPIPVLEVVEKFLKHADLVKFARLTPTADECTEALARGEQIVKKTIPVPILPQHPPLAPAAPRPGVDAAPPAAPPGAAP